MLHQKNKEQRMKDFIKALKKISIEHGVTIETNSPPYVLNVPQEVTYIINPKTKAIFPVWLNTELDKF